MGELIPFIWYGKQISWIHKPFLTLLLRLLSLTSAVRNEGIALEGRHIMQVFRCAGNCSLLTGMYLMICWSESQQQGQALEGAGSAELCLVQPCLDLLELPNTSHPQQTSPKAPFLYFQQGPDHTTFPDCVLSALPGPRPDSHGCLQPPELP